MKFIRFLMFIIFACCMVLTENCCLAAPQSWPVFHGISRDNKSTETGLLKAWPVKGPELLYTVKGLGHGYGSVVIADDLIFTSGQIDDETFVFCLDLKGTLIWKQSNGKSWKAGENQKWAANYFGSRGTPTVSDRKVYQLSELGRLTCFDVKTGKVLWSTELMEVFKAERPTYGYSESVVIDGNVLYCTPCGEKGYLAAYDKNNGKLIWASDPVNEKIGYSSIIISEIHGIKQLITYSSLHVLGFSAKDGKLLWSYPVKNKRKNNISDVIVHGDSIYATSGYGRGSILLKQKTSGAGDLTVEALWDTEVLDNMHGGVIEHQGYLYGSGDESRGWTCLDFKTGEKKWVESGKGAITFADGFLYCLDENGTLKLARAVPEKWICTGHFKIPKGGPGAFWAHPVVCGGRLYVRHSEKLYIYDIREKEKN